MAGGEPEDRLESVTMPRIDDDFLNCSFYVYPDEERAREGSRAGGSGFLIHVPLAFEPWVQVYAVTNRHVIDGGCGALRLNTSAGPTDIMQTGQCDWVMHPELDDVAIAPMQMAPRHRWTSINAGCFVTQQMLLERAVGVGDEVLMIGRLSGTEGIGQNTPVARFGHLSMMPRAIDRANGLPPQESFLVECRSVSGFSGSRCS